MRKLEDVLKAVYGPNAKFIGLEKVDNKSVLKIKCNKNIKGYFVYENGWYHLKDEDGYSLYKADGTLVADKLTYCEVFSNGWYHLNNGQDAVLYRADSSIVVRQAWDCHVYKNG